MEGYSLGTSSGIEIATEIFRYLAEYTQLRMRQQRTLDAWEASWAADWPNELEVGSVFRLGEHELGSGILLTVRKPRRTPPPMPQDDYLPWFDRATISDSALDAPKVLRQIRVSSEDPKDPEELSAVELRMLQDNPEVLAYIKRYISGTWLPWAEADQRRAAVQSLYGTLFSWLQRQTQMAEQWELILGLGLLTWKERTASDIIKRPLVVVPVSLEMDSASGTITVSVQADGGGPALELDMLSSDQRPDAESQRTMKSLVAEAGDVWDRSVGNGVLRTVANQLAADAEYDESDDYRATYESRPRVTFAPGLFMRKRTERTIHFLLTSIADQLAATKYVPPGISAVLGLDVAPTTNLENTDEIEGSKPALSPELVDEMVFFPKKSNDEQKLIVKKLASSRGGLIVRALLGLGSRTRLQTLCVTCLREGIAYWSLAKGRERCASCATCFLNKFRTYVS